MEDLISVIVPVYKVEQYLDRCIQSILNQSYQNFELLLVDDGSPDSSPEICDSYLSKDKRVRVYHKKNGGLSSARNYGLDHCFGQYIAFIDSDDFVAVDYLMNMMRAVSEGDYDIVQCKYKEVPCTSKLNHERITLKTEEINAIDKIEAINGRKYKVASWLCLYKRHLFDETRYTEGIINEDDDIYYKLAYFANKIAIIDHELYFYCLSPDSIMRNGKDRKLDFISIYQNRIKFFKDHCELQLEEGTYIRFCIVLLLRYSESIVYGNNKRDRKQFLDLFQKYYPKAIGSEYVTKKEKLLLGCFHFAPNIVGSTIGRLKG